jgi:hypothetical protein
MWATPIRTIARRTTLFLEHIVLPLWSRGAIEIGIPFHPSELVLQATLPTDATHLPGTQLENLLYFRFQRIVQVLGCPCSIFCDYSFTAGNGLALSPIRCACSVIRITIARGETRVFQASKFSRLAVGAPCQRRSLPLPAISLWITTDRNLSAGQ